MSGRVCSIDGCGRKHKGNGLCETHLSRLRRTGVRGGPIAVRGRRGLPCQNGECDQPQYSLGYCRKCYYRFKRYADANGGFFRRGEGTPKQRFMAQFRNAQADGDCLIWAGRMRPDGYGAIDHPFSEMAHRVAWYEFIGPVPQGLAIHHECARRSCVNPNHLAPVTYAQNTAEMLERTYYQNRIRELEAKLEALTQAD